jgi:hypothetical protein
MEFYSNSRPNLIGSKMKKTVNKIVKDQSYNGTVSDKISHQISILYKEYVEDNKLVVFILLAIIIFLLYRYYNRREPNKTTEGFYMYTDPRRFNKVEGGENYDQLVTQGHFNPIKPLNDQAVTVNYTPDPLPIRLPNEGIVLRRNIYDDPDPYPSINVLKDDYYKDVCDEFSGSYYTGRYNTYEDAPDIPVPNVLGYPNTVNFTTDNFTRGMTDKNNKAITDYKTILASTNQNLIDALKLGPKYIDANMPDMDMEPPYATEY